MCVILDLLAFFWSLLLPLPLRLALRLRLRRVRLLCRSGEHAGALRLALASLGGGVLWTSVRRELALSSAGNAFVSWPAGTLAGTAASTMCPTCALAVSPVLDGATDAGSAAWCGALVSAVMPLASSAVASDVPSPSWRRCSVASRSFVAATAALLPSPDVVGPARSGDLKHDLRRSLAAGV